MISGCLRQYVKNIAVLYSRLFLYVNYVSLSHTQRAEQYRAIDILVKQTSREFFDVWCTHVRVCSCRLLLETRRALVLSIVQPCMSFRNNVVAKSHVELDVVVPFGQWLCLYNPFCGDKQDSKKQETH